MALKKSTKALIRIAKRERPKAVKAVMSNLRTNKTNARKDIAANIRRNRKNFGPGFARNMIFKGYGYPRHINPKYAESKK